jgi:REP element-mobilizing transposase RayT
MARPLRLEFPGAIYHLTSRGDRREAIYEDDNDRIQWLGVLSKACERYNWRVHAYCLMDNHYHVLLETVDGNLSKGMRHLNGVYTQYFNRQHNRVGHVFQGRFKAILVEREAYLLGLSRYVVLNPIRAHMIKDMDQWEWSSYRATIGKAQIPDWLETDWLLSHFGKQRKRARERYIDFVRAGVGLPSIWENLRNQVFLGGENFIGQYREMITEKVELDEIPALQKRATSKPINDYQDQYKDENIAIKEAYLSGGYTMKEIGEHFGKHYTTISRIIKRYE